MKKFSLFLLLTTLFFACSKFEELGQTDRIAYQAEYAIPLGSTDFTMQDILKNFEENSSFIIDPDGLIRFKYSGDVITKTADEVFDAVNETLNSVPVIPLLTKKQALPFSSPEGLQMDLLDVKAGTLTYVFQNSHDESVDVTLTIPQLTLNGVAFRFETSVEAFSGSGTPPSVNNYDTPVDISGYRILPENDSVFIEYQALDASGDTLEKLSFGAISISEVSFSYMEGYLGSQLHEGKRDTIVIDLFENWINGDVYFVDPKITWHFENSFGMPMRSIVHVFDVHTVREETLALESEFISNGVDFPYPSLDEVGQVKMADYLHTKENSNIDVILSAGPVAIDYDIDAITNPDSDNTIRGFITENSFYKVTVDVELPLYGDAFNFEAKDTFDVDFSNYEDVNEAEFKLITENKMPLSVDLQAYFLDDNGNPIDSLLDDRQRVLEAVPVDGEGYATTETEKITYIPISSARFTKLLQAKKLAMLASFSTYNDGQVPVKVLAGQGVSARLGVKVGVGN